VLVVIVISRFPSVAMLSDVIEKPKMLLSVPEEIEVEETENDTKKGTVN
jgi:hypothetical protein